MILLRAAITLLLASSIVLSANAQDRIAGVASVVDGDTIEIHGQRIRLFGIDARSGDGLDHSAVDVSAYRRGCDVRTVRREHEPSLTASPDQYRHFEVGFYCSHICADSGEKIDLSHVKLLRKRAGG